MSETKKCPYCGQEIPADAKVCSFCNKPLEPAANAAASSGPVQQVVVNQIQKKSNGMGTAGFVLALVGLLLCWVPVLNWILWILGLIFSFIGVFKRPRGLAIAGLIITFVGLIIIVAVISVAVASLI